MNRHAPRIFISAAEDSADVHAASLIRCAAERLPDARFHGLTGPRMRAAGAETLDDMTAHAAMLGGVVSVAGRAWQVLRRIERSWRESPPDLVVLLDSPALHMRLARRARSLDIPVLYYIAPQTWASRERRNAQIARDIDRLACILPFEEPYFRERGIAAEFVGHPLFEALQREAADPQRVARLRCGDGPLIAILPGSRRHVVETMLPLQLAVARSLRSAGVGVRCAISAVSAARAEDIARIREGAGQAIPASEIVVDDNASLLTAADLVLVASGTATLHVAHYRKPMIVMYDAGALLGGLFRAFGRGVVRTPHLSLVNILAGRRVVPEFMPYVRDVEAVATVARKLLEDAGWRRLMVEQIDEVVRPLEGSRASERVVGMIEETIGAGVAP